MIADISKILNLLKINPQVIKGIKRGIERECLRINVDAELALTQHPKSLGAALTHKWITTDFSESLLEFITPIHEDIDNMFTFLQDLHRYTTRQLTKELFWPFSMPCSIDNTESIILAQYGNSNIGRMKTLYRKGLKHRYNAITQIISGIHYNFSFPNVFWQFYSNIYNTQKSQETISAGYLHLIRNYYRFGWVIPYLFGASPGICPSSINQYNYDLPFEKIGSNLLYLPYATSLRLNDLNYTNKHQNKLNITFNQLNEYITILKKAIKTPCVEYQRIGLKKNGEYLQLNTNVLQIENELYIPIRPKRTTDKYESLSDALMNKGIEYIEIRSLDINPFSPIGVNKDQIRFLDLYLIWCILSESPKINLQELYFIRLNWKKVIIEGRNPQLMLTIGQGRAQQPLNIIIKSIFKNLICIAEVIDNIYKNTYYQQICEKLMLCCEYPQLTLSAQLLNQLIKYGINTLGLNLSNNYFNKLYNESLEMMTQEQLEEENITSWYQQKTLETTNNLDFDSFLKNQFL